MHKTTSSKYSHSHCNSYTDLSNSLYEWEKKQLGPLLIPQKHHQAGDQETRILEFLEKEGVEFKTPWDKMYDYLDNIRYNKEKNESSQSPTNISVSSVSSLTTKKFTLNSKLYQKIKQIQKK